MMQARRWAPMALVLGCGPSSEDDGDDGDDVNVDTGDDDDDDDDDDSGTSMTGDDGMDGDSDTGTPSCNEDDVGPPPPLSIAMGVRNETDAPIFLPRNGCNDPISVRGPDGGGSPTISFPDCELPSCTQLIDGDCSVACAGGSGACFEAVVRVDPGATHVREWNGAVWTETTLPAACVPDDCAAECFQAIAASPGTYTIEAGVGECPNADPAACECPGGESSCDIEAIGDAEIPTPVASSVEFTFPDDVMPTIVVR